MHAVLPHVRLIRQEPHRHRAHGPEQQKRRGLEGPRVQPGHHRAPRPALPGLARGEGHDEDEHPDADVHQGRPVALRLGEGPGERPEVDPQDGDRDVERQRGAAVADGGLPQLPERLHCRVERLPRKSPTEGGHGEAEDEEEEGRRGGEEERGRGGQEAEEDEDDRGDDDQEVEKSLEEVEDLVEGVAAGGGAGTRELDPEAEEDREEDRDDGDVLWRLACMGAREHWSRGTQGSDGWRSVLGPWVHKRAGLCNRECIPSLPWRARRRPR